MDAIILAGGLGTRLSGVVADRPKPMALVGGRPFVEWLILALRAQGIRRVILATGYRRETVETHFGDGGRWGMEIVYSPETTPLGTGGAARLALTRATSARVLVLNGDSYCPFDLRALAVAHERCRARVTLWLTALADGSRYGLVEIDPAGRVLTFREKTSAVQAGLINAGVYLFEQEALTLIPAGQEVSLEKNVFPRLIGQGLCGVVGAGPFLDIGTPAAYQQAPDYLQGELQRLEKVTKDATWLARARAHVLASAGLKRPVAETGLGPVLRAARLVAALFNRGSATE